MICYYAVTAPDAARLKGVVLGVFALSATLLLAGRIPIVASILLVLAGVYAAVRSIRTKVK